ncbi:MAG TPA: MFS transporter [Dongiaceae bacterium]
MGLVASWGDPQLLDVGDLAARGGPGQNPDLAAWRARARGPPSNVRQSSVKERPRIEKSMRPKHEIGARSVGLADATALDLRGRARQRRLDRRGRGRIVSRPMAGRNNTIETKDRNRTLAAVIGTAFGVGVSIGAVVPLLSLILEQRGFDATAIGTNAGMSPLGAVAFSFLVPRIITQLGLLKAIIASISLTGVLMLLFPAIDGYLAWCVIRLAIGCVGVVHWIASETWINLLARDDNRSRVMAIYATVLAGGFASGPLLLSLTGTEGWLPFLAVAATALVALAPVPLIRSVPLALGRMPHTGMFGVMRVVPLVAAAALAAGFVDASLFSLIPVYQVRAGHAEQLAVLSLSIFMAGNLVLQYPLGWIADHTSRRHAAIATAAVIALGAIAYPLMLTVPGESFWLMMFIWGGVSWGMYTLGLALLGESLEPTRLAAGNAAFVMMYEIGSITGPVVSGAALDRWPIVGLPVSIGVTAALFIGVALVRRR